MTTVITHALATGYEFSIPLQVTIGDFFVAGFGLLLLMVCGVYLLVEVLR
jgi:hypothetical protein